LIFVELKLYKNKNY